MKVFPFITLLSALICVFIADIVYHSNKKEVLNKVFTAACLSTAYLLFYYFMCKQAVNIETAYFWIKFGSFWPFTFIFFLHFALIFTEKKKLLKNKLTYLILYVPPLFFSIAGLATDWLAGQTIKDEFGGYLTYYVVRNYPFVDMIIIVWELLVISLIILLCIHYYLRITDKLKKIKAGYILLSFSVPFLLIFFQQSLVLIKVRIPQVDSFVMLWINTCIGYAIRKYDLFKINPVKAAENIIDTMPDALVLIDLEDKIVLVNPSLVKSFLYPEEEIIGKSIDILFENTESMNTVLNDLFRNKIVVNFETQFKTSSGKIIPVLLSGSVIENTRRQRIGIVFIVRDITERKQIEKELLSFNTKLQQSNHALQEFAYIASHDLQEPLRKITAFGDRLKKKYASSLGEKGRDYLERMQNSIERMQTLIDDLLAYSRITSITKPYSNLNLSQIIKEVLSDLEVMIEKTSAKIEVSLLPVIEADPTQMRQLFQNLIGNALKFYKPDVTPVVKVYSLSEASADYYSIVVEDNGIGIDEKDQDKIFGVFQRLHGKDKYGGSGIGLSVCKKIVERHGGTIRVESMPGEGTQFIIHLPKKQGIG